MKNEINEKKILISIIVPAYNVESYLIQCLNSIICQTYTNIEVILINDGSTDNTGSICEEYSKNDSRVKVIHTKNKGVSSARNLGISLATGNYIAFVDSDDWLERNAIEKVNSVLQDDLYDIIMYGIVKENSDQDKIKIGQEISSSHNNYHKIMNVLPELVKSEKINSPIKIYKKDLILNNEIKFDSRINIGEDYLFNMTCILNANSLYIMRDILYHYMNRDNVSLSRKFHVDKYEQLMLVNDKIDEMINLRGKSKEIEEALLYIRLKNVYSCFLDIFNKNCNYSYKEKLNFINGIINRHKDFNYLKINNKSFKLLGFILKLKSKKIVYATSKLIYLLKK